MLARLLSSIVGIVVLTQASHAATIIPAHTEGNASWPYQVYKTSNATPPYLNITNAYKPSEGYLFFAPDSATAFKKSPLIMDMDGELVWNGSSIHAFGFGPQTYNGEQVLVYWNGSVFPEPVGRGNGVIHLLNKYYESVANVTLPGNFLELTPGASFPSNIDLHEIFITANGSMLVTANNVTQRDLSSVGGATDGWIVDCFVYEIDIATNEVLFSWSSLDHVDQLPLTDSVYPLGSEGFDGHNQSTAWGYFHINAVSPFEDGYIISSRYFCAGIAIGADGNVKWIMQGRDGGDFTLGKGADFCYQHDIRAIPEHPSSNQSVVQFNLHDNHNCPIDNNTVPSSGKSLSVNFDTKEVSLLKRYLNESGPVYATAQGSFQALPDGNVFIGHGWVPILEEFSQSGITRSTIQFGAAVPKPGGGYYSALAPTLSYRAFKAPWVGCPRTLPSVAAEKGDNGTVVYVSWNGATEVEAWSIYAGATASSLKLIETMPKTGFETATEIGAQTFEIDYVQVRPMYKASEHWRKGYGNKCAECDELGDVRSAIVTVT